VLVMGGLECDILLALDFGQYNTNTRQPCQAAGFVLRCRLPGCPYRPGHRLGLVGVARRFSFDRV
jgi:hypothetical protein